MSTLEMLTEEQARHRRAEIVASLRHGSEAELRARAALYLLDSDDLAALDKLDELDFLLASTG
jgi:hypothetical protein